MSNLQTSVTINLAGNLVARARKFQQSLGTFATDGRRQLAALNTVAARSGMLLDRVGNRYAALITGVAGISAARGVISLEARLTRLGTNASATAEQIDALKRQIFEVSQAPDVRIDPAQMIDAIDQILEKTGDLKFATDNIRTLGLAIQASGATGADIGSIAAEFEKMGLSSKEVAEAIDVLIVQGKAGAFTLEKLAALGPRVITAYTATGRGGVQALREMGAALQTIMRGTGDAERASTTFEALLATLQDKDKLKLLRRAGIQVFDPVALKQGKEQMRPINEILKDILAKTKGKKTALSAIFDREAIRTFNDLLSNGGTANMDAFFGVVADGSTTLADAATNARTAQAALTDLNTSLRKSTDEHMAGPIQWAADFSHKIGPSATSALIGAGMGAGVALGGAVVARKLWQGGRAAMGMLRGAGRALAPTTIGVDPATGFKIARSGSAARAAMALGRAGLMAGRFLLTTPVGLGLTAAGIGGYALYKYLHRQGADAARQVAAPTQPAARLEGTINLKVDGPARVTSATTNQPGIRVNVDTGLSLAGGR